MGFGLDRLDRLAASGIVIAENDKVGENEEIADDRYIDPEKGAAAKSEDAGFSADEAVKFWKSKKFGKRSFSEREVTISSFDIGFPLVYQNGTRISIEVAREMKSFDHSAPKEALVVRWNLTKPALGQYVINASLPNISYQMYRADVEPEGTWKLDYKIPTSIAFDVVELIYFSGDDRPKLVLKSKEEKSKWATWQCFSKEEFRVIIKGKKLCDDHRGKWLENSELGYGWCRFPRLEGVVSQILYEYLEGSKTFKDRVKKVYKNSDPDQKMVIMQGIFSDILKTPYSANCKGKAYQKGLCWTPIDLKRMGRSAIFYQNRLRQESGY